MVHPDSAKYRIPERDFHLPHFTDFFDARWAHSEGGKSFTQPWLMYYQWLHCVGNWGEEHSMCKKARWYCHALMHETDLETMDKKKKLGFYDHVVLYGKKPFRGFEPHYKPVKKNRPGAYEWWLARDFEPLSSEDAHHWREKAPILYDMFVFGKKPIWDSKEGEDEVNDTPTTE